MPPLRSDRANPPLRIRRGAAAVLEQGTSDIPQMALLAHDRWRVSAAMDIFPLLLCDIGGAAPPPSLPTLPHR